MPRPVAADGGLTSRNNLSYAKGIRSGDGAVVAKKRGLTVMEMAKSAWVVQAAAELQGGH